MRKSTCTTLIKDMLMDINKGYGSRKWKNPEYGFNLNDRNGRYEKLNDNDYCIIKIDMEKAGDLWRGESETPVTELFARFMECLDIGNQCIADIAGLLSACYEKSTGSFLPELDIPEFMTEKPDTRRTEEQRIKNAQPCNMPPVNVKDPRQIYNYLTTYVHGQEDACKAASMLLYNHLQGKRRNLLFIGPTGCGKTEIWRICSRLYPNIVIVDSDRLTADGWSGAFKIRDIFTDRTKAEIERLVVVFDEFDKLCEPMYSHGSNYSHSIQNNLLKLIEGEVMTFPADRGNPAIRFDSSRISFVFLGSFEHLTELKSANEADRSIGFCTSIEKPDADAVYTRQITQDDLKYSGMRREIAGRINQIVQLSPMTTEDYIEILENNNISPIYKLEREYHVSIHVPERTRMLLAKEAANSRMGVRYLQSRIQAMLDDEMFHDNSRAEYCLDGGKAPKERDKCI